MYSALQILLAAKDESDLDTSLHSIQMTRKPISNVKIPDLHQKTVAALEGFGELNTLIKYATKTQLILGSWFNDSLWNIVIENSMPGTENFTILQRAIGQDKTKRWLLEFIGKCYLGLAKPEPKTSLNSVNPMVNELKAILTRSIKSSGIKLVLFVDDYLTAFLLRQWISRTEGLSQLTCSILESNNTKNNLFSVKIKDQRFPLEEFISGNSKLLIVTSRAEKEFEIPACSIVARFNPSGLDISTPNHENLFSKRSHNTAAEMELIQILNPGKAKKLKQQLGYNQTNKESDEAKVIEQSDKIGQEHIPESQVAVEETQGSESRYVWHIALDQLDADIYQPIAIISQSQIPVPPALQLLLPSGHKILEFNGICVQMNFTMQELKMIENFTIFTLKMVVETQLNKLNTLPYLIAPCQTKQNKVKIEWEKIRLMVSTGEQPGQEISVGTIVTERIRKDSFSVVDEILDESFFGDDSKILQALNVRIHQYIKKRHLETKVDKSRILKLVSAPVIENFFNHTGRSTKKLKPIYTVPEFCQHQKFDIQLHQSAQTFPALLTWIEYTIRALNLSQKLSLKLQTDSLLEALIMPSAIMHIDNEKLKLRGHEFLRFILSLHFFVRNPKLSERSLSFKRDGIIRNKNMYRLCKSLEIQKYIVTKEYRKKKWRLAGYLEAENINYSSDSNSEKPNLQPEKIVDAFKAIIGAIVLSLGEDEALQACLHLVLESKDTYDWGRVKQGFLSKIGKHNGSNETGAQDITAIIKQYFGYSFESSKLMLTALSHRSESSNEENTFQQLEFIGDALYDYLLPLHLASLPSEMFTKPVGVIKTTCICNAILALVCCETKLHRFISHNDKKIMNEISKYANTLQKSKRDNKQFWENIDFPKFLADTVEAMLGAIFIDCGFNIAVMKGVISIFFQNSLLKYIEL